MPVESATVSLTRTITVGAGVFAPGHLGELTRYAPFELVDAVLAETGRVQRRVRAIPARVAVYFVLALGLFPHLGYARVWDKLVAALTGLPLPSPSEAALRQARRRLGVAPLRALFEAVAGPLARPDTPGVCYRRWRTVAFDGCSSFKAADTAGLRAWLGKIRHPAGWAGYPSLMLMALVETGTRGLIGARFGPIRRDGEPGEGGELGYARALLSLLTRDMLVLADRGFDSNDFLTAVAATGAQLLIRARSLRRPPVLAALSDGSYLTKIDGLSVRVIEATLAVTTANGITIGGSYRLLTTLTDHRRHPALTLLKLYHERWEIESAFYALRHTMFRGRVLRSHTPTGLDQELWALLTVYQLLRAAITDATETRPGTDPDRSSFTIACEHARNQLTNAAGIIATPDQPSIIGAATTRAPLPPRRRRASSRKVKCPTSRYASQPPDDPRPATSSPITNTSYTICPRTHTARPTSRRTGPHHINWTHQILDLFHHHTGPPLPTTKIAAELGISYDHARSKLNTLTRQGLLHRPTPGHYTAAPQRPLTNHPPP